MINVTSEIGRLRRVLVHEPGPEVDRMVPAMMEQLLFDDILDGDRAREEHAQFRRVMQLFGVEVIEASTLLETALATGDARRWVIDVLLQDLDASDRAKLEGFTDHDLASLLVAGSRPRAHAAGVEVEDLYEVPPLPNWCFQRDPQIILGREVILPSMAAPARHREGLLTRTIFGFHPELRSVPVLLDPIATDQTHPMFLDLQRPALEGGDVLVVSKEILVVGVSERTNRIAIKHLERGLAKREDGPRWLITVPLPRRRAYMHLDTLITPVDHDACLVYPPVILAGGREQAEAYEVDLHADEPAVVARGPLLDCLRNRGVDLEPIPCGGSDPVSQQREQWTDGANALALAPGTIVLYARNRVTADVLDQHGFRILDAKDLLLGREEASVDSERRGCVLLPSHEMSRARGGPHCLTHPLLRDALE
jgi:arginine deiminase